MIRNGWQLDAAGIAAVLHSSAVLGVKPRASLMDALVRRIASLASSPSSSFSSCSSSSSNLTNEGARVPMPRQGGGGNLGVVDSEARGGEGKEARGGEGKEARGGEGCSERLKSAERKGSLGAYEISNILWAWASLDSSSNRKVTDVDV